MMLLWWFLITLHVLEARGLTRGLTGKRSERHWVQSPLYHAWSPEKRPTITPRVDWIGPRSKYVYTIFEGEVGTSECQHVRYKDRVSYSPRAYGYSAGDYNLTIITVRNRDKGVYKCSVNYAGRMVYSQQVQLVVDDDKLQQPRAEVDRYPGRNQPLQQQALPSKQRPGDSRYQGSYVIGTYVITITLIVLMAVSGLGTMVYLYFYLYEFLDRDLSRKYRLSRIPGYYVLVSLAWFCVTLWLVSLMLSRGTDST